MAEPDCTFLQMHVQRGDGETRAPDGMDRAARDHVSLNRVRSLQRSYQTRAVAKYIDVSNRALSNALD